MNRDSLGRVRAMVLRYVYLHRRSLPRSLEIFYWPVMEMLVWGYLAVYLETLPGSSLGGVAKALVSAMIFWDILYRSQQAVSLSFVEDIWSQNIVNLLVSPLRTWEWILAASVYGFLKTLLITVLLALIAWWLYALNWIGELHLYLLPLLFNLLFFGWALGIFTSSLVIRWGHAAEALIWGVPFLIQPLSAIFYPLAVLPPWLRGISQALPSTYVFEGMRAVLTEKRLPMEMFWTALALNAVYFVAAGFFFRWMFVLARRSGRLGHLGMD